MIENLPARIISWYGDDFTGSTDALEALASQMRAVLFLRQPEEQFFARFSDYAAFGLAGSSRSQTPTWMDEHLEPAFRWLDSLGTAVCHYKVCSTFDSAPQTGSIGRAMEIGKRVFGSRFIPMVVGAPSLRRYTVFGNLFAGVNGVVYRIDRHPTMSRHPVTPMREADLRIHLKHQTELRIGLLDTLQLDRADASRHYEELGKEFQSVMIDVANEGALAKAGQLLWQVDRQRFIVGSSGVEYALIDWWRSQGWAGTSSEKALFPAVDRLLVLSGSCSPVTQSQIEHAAKSGFALVRLDIQALAGGERTMTAAAEARQAALQALSQGRSVVLFTSMAPQDRCENFASAAEEHEFRQTLAERGGEILRQVLDESGVKRVVVAGGDTSSHAGRQLDIDALTFRAPLAAGAPLCQAWSGSPERKDLEIVFKGGQCGDATFFEKALKGNHK